MFKNIVFKITAAIILPMSFSSFAQRTEIPQPKVDISAGFASWELEGEKLLIIGNCDYSPPRFK